MPLMIACRPLSLSLLAAHVRRQVRLHLFPLIVSQPEQVLSHALSP